jgi:hypothetical protein
MGANLHAPRLGHAHRFHHQRWIARVESAGDVGDVDDLEELLIRSLRGNKNCEYTFLLFFFLFLVGNYHLPLPESLPHIAIDLDFLDVILHRREPSPQDFIDR